MAISKFIYNGVTQIDVTQSTVTPNNLLSGQTAIGANGEVVTGAYVPPTAGDEFVVKMTLSNGEWSPDRTFNEIKAAYIGEKQIVVTSSTSSTEVGFSCDFDDENTFLIHVYENLSSGNYKSVKETHYSYTASGFTKLTSFSNYDTQLGTTNAEDVPSGKVFWSNGGRTIGSGDVMEENDVTYYDYDGTIIASYSKEDFANLVEPPANPTHEGLTAQGWNWSFSDAKAYVASYGKLIIGQSYVTASGATEIDIVLDDPDYLSPYLCISINGEVEVDWGDGSETDTLTGSSYTSLIDTQHIYPATGNYTISISGNSFAFYGGADPYKHYGAVLRVGTTLYEYYATVYSNTIKHIRLGNNVRLERQAFQCCGELKTVTFPVGLVSIGTYAFIYCRKLKTAILPNTMTDVETYAFYYNDNLEIISLPRGLTTLTASMIYGAGKIKLLTPSDNITAIFGISYCRNLKEVIIPAGVTSIYLNIFTFYDLDTIVIRDNIETITGSLGSDNRIKYIKFPTSATLPNSALQNSEELVTAILPNNITAIPNYLFNGCYNLQTVTIPSTVTSIGTYAFRDCYTLRTLTIPSNVTTIGTYAFYNCFLLKEFHFLSVLPPTLGNNAFSFNSTSSSVKIYVPEQSVDVYKTASGWSTYASLIYGE